MRVEKFAGATVCLAGGQSGRGDGDGALVVLLHGFGAPGRDLVDLATRVPAPRATRFAFPAAPIELGGEHSRAWWLIDVVGLQIAVASGRRKEVCESDPPGLSQARAFLDAVLEDLLQREGASTLYLGGFSQGAILACDYALSSPRSLSGLALFSVLPLAEPRWTRALASRKGLRVYQSHGRLDPVLPFEEAERWAGVMRSAELDVAWQPFVGAHGIPPTVCESFGRFLG
jgi:phospholipase/carboxylesterase